MVAVSELENVNLTTGLSVTDWGLKLDTGSLSYEPSLLAELRSRASEGDLRAVDFLHGRSYLGGHRHINFSDQEYLNCLIKVAEQPLSEDELEHVVTEMARLYLYGKGVPRDIKRARIAMEYVARECKFVSPTSLLDACRADQPNDIWGLLAVLVHFYTPYFKLVLRNKRILAQCCESSQWESYELLDVGITTDPENKWRHNIVIKSYLGNDVDGIFDGRRLMENGSFIIDLRNPNRGRLWKFGHAPSSGNGSHDPVIPDRFPRVLVAVEGREAACRLETITHVSFIPNADSTGERCEEFYFDSTPAVRLSLPTRKLKVCTGGIQREIPFADSSAVEGLRVQPAAEEHAVVGNAILEGALLSWKSGEEFCRIHPVVEGHLQQDIVGSHFNRPNYSQLRSFKEYFLGTPVANGEAFDSDLAKIGRLENGSGTSGTIVRRLLLNDLDVGGRADYLKGRQRTLFLAAAFFKVLIDQVFHHHYKHHHALFESLSPAVKLDYRMAYNVEPELLLTSSLLRGDPQPDKSFEEAIAYFESETRQLVSCHFPNISPDEVWGRVRGHFPAAAPYFRNGAED
jgi:hypothetical protein